MSIEQPGDLITAGLQPGDDILLASNNVANPGDTI